MRFEGFSLGRLHRFAMTPCVHVDALDDLISKPPAQIVGIHRVQLPGLITVIPFERGVPWVSALGFGVERWQAAAIGLGQ